MTRRRPRHRSGWSSSNTGQVFDTFGTAAEKSRQRESTLVAAARPSALRVRLTCCLIGGAGLVLVIGGSFLPWVVSGTVRRSSYAIVGVLGRLGIGDDGPIGVLVGAWPLVGVLCMTPVVAAAVRWWRTSGVLAVLLALAAGLLSFGVILLTSGRSAGGIGVDPVGPAVMAAGAVLLFCGGIALALGAGSPIRRTIG